jgi:hypothetical protein
MFFGSLMAGALIGIYNPYAGAGITVLWIVMIIAVNVGLWTWQALDAYNLTKKYNDSVMVSGAPPW